MKYSRQRELILQAVQNASGHPAADEIYAALRQSEPSLSLGTVYRNLNLLAAHGLIRRVPVPGAADRFDAAAEAHHHLFCTRCGGVFDLAPGLAGPFAEALLRATGFWMDPCGLTVRGVCEACRAEEKHETAGGREHEHSTQTQEKGRKPS